MPQYLNTSKTGIELMGERKAATALETTTCRIAAELGIPLQDTGGASYARALDGSGRIELEYHRDFDGYESFKASNSNAVFSISKIEDRYKLHLKNSGEKLMESSRRREPKNSAERKINLGLIMLPALRKDPEKKHEPVLEIEESDLDLITAETIQQYLP